MNKFSIQPRSFGPSGLTALACPALACPADIARTALRPCPGLLGPTIQALAQAWRPYRPIFPSRMAFWRPYRPIFLSRTPFQRPHRPIFPSRTTSRRPYRPIFPSRTIFQRPYRPIFPSRTAFWRPSRSIRPSRTTVWRFYRLIFPSKTTFHFPPTSGPMLFLLDDETYMTDPTIYKFHKDCCSTLMTKHA